MTDGGGPPGFRVLACQASRTGTAVVLVVAGALGQPDCALADRVEVVLAAGAHVVVDVTRLERADVAAVAALARLQLRMRAGGGSICLRGSTSGLRVVVELLGFGDILPDERSG